MSALVVIILLATLTLASGHTSASPPNDVSTAALQTQAAQGDAKAQFDLGWMYLNGKGMPQDYTKAWDWFEKAAAQGDVKAQYVLGGLYSDWPSVRQSNVKGLMWLNIATARLMGTEQQEVAKIEIGSPAI